MLRKTLTWGDCLQLSRRALNAITPVFIIGGRQREILLHTEDEAIEEGMERFGEAGSADWRDAASRQEMLAATRSWKGKVQILPGISGGSAGLAIP